MAADQFLSLPGDAAGLAPATAASVWGFGSYVEVISAAANTTDKAIIGITFQSTFNLTAGDQTHGFFFELSTGAAGAETIQLQFPTSIRPDSLVGYFFSANIMLLPEPYLLPAGTRLAVRVAQGPVAATTYNGVKVLYQELAPALTTVGATRSTT